MQCKMHVQVFIDTDAQPTSKNSCMVSVYVCSHSDCSFLNVISRHFFPLQLLCMQSVPFTLLA